MAIISQVFDSSEESILEVDSNLNLVTSMPQAESMVRFFFPTHTDSARLPDQLLSWLTQEVAILSKGDSSAEQMATSSFNRCSRKLIVIAFIRIGMGAMTISFKEDPVALSGYQRLVAQLTRRQTEVFHFLSDGVRDVYTIAKELGISHRTVEEHRRVINQKAKSINHSILY